MAVRFPLDQAFSWGKICDRPTLDFSPITDLSAFVDGRRVTTEKIYQTVEIWSDKEPYPTITRPCWEFFEVTFPPDTDVIIKVTYTAQPYNYGSGYSYSYVLLTGAGWEGTIGNADISLQLPYSLDPFNFIGCRPDDCVMTDDEIRWHYEDFEPDFNVGASLLPPPIWRRILAEKNNITANPNNGQAWGRLAEAYKEAILERRGFRSDPTGMEIYKLSEQAYQQALVLQPQDTDWHYGYADLLCWNAEWNRFFTTEIEALQACVSQARQTLDIDPKHEATNALLQSLAQFDNPKIISFDGEQVVYLILTSIPTATATPPLPTATITPTWTPTLTRPIPSARPTKTSTSPALLTEFLDTPTAMPSKTNANIEYNYRVILLIGVFLAAGGLALGILRLRR